LPITADVDSGHFVLQDANSHHMPSRRWRSDQLSAHDRCSPTPRPLDVGDCLDRRSDDADEPPTRTGASASSVTVTPAVNGIRSGFQQPL